MKKKEYEYDYMFDWIIRKSKLKEDFSHKIESKEETDYKEMLK